MATNRPWACTVQAEFTDSHTLRLTGVASTAQFYGAGASPSLNVVAV